MVNSVNEMKVALSDKMAVLQVLGGLINNPLLFTNKQYSLKIDDFPERFHRVLFGAIEYLAAQGLTTINVMDIDQFLINYDVQYKVFTDNQGMKYVQQCMQLTDPNKFDYYYNIVKKSSLLGELYEKGFDISEILDVNETDPNTIATQRAKFDNMSINDILAIYDTKLIGITQKYSRSSEMVKCTAGTNLKQLKEGYKEIPDIGAPLISPKCTTIFRGQRLKKLYIESSFAGGGKSRRALGEAAHLSIPQFYDIHKKKWVNTGLSESVLFISIELEPEELQTPVIAYVSGVSENAILDGKYSLDEEARVDKAIEYIEQSKLYFVQISDFDTDDIEGLIKQYKQLYNVRYIFFDYMATSMKIMAQAASRTKVQGLREDQILLMMATRLKELCNQLNIHLHTATQLNGEWKTAKEADQNLLRGAKSISDKADIGMILLPVREADQPLVDTYLAKGFTTQPNLVMHIYKVRKGRMNHIRLFIYFDYATCRSEDCFVVDKNGEFLNVEDTQVEVLLDETEDEEANKKKWGDFVL